MTNGTGAPIGSDIVKKRTKSGKAQSKKASQKVKKMRAK